MGKRVFVLTVLSLLLGVCAGAQIAPVRGEKRPGDRDAVLKSLDRIFQGFIHQDDEALRATHAPQWLGFLEGASNVMHGVEEYMAASTSPVKPAVHMAAYKLLEIDVLFYGDVAKDVRPTSGQMVEYWMAPRLLDPKTFWSLAIAPRAKES